MTKYRIEVQVTRTYEFEVEAENQVEAQIKAVDTWAQADEASTNKWETKEPTADVIAIIPVPGA